jgi:hypothetical protein
LLDGLPGKPPELQGRVPPTEEVDQNAVRNLGPWHPDEDSQLSKLVSKYTATKWSFIASHLPGRIAKQCRERWHNHLDPTVCKDPWTETEDLVITQTRGSIGNQWSAISKTLPGRTDNAIKNRWNSTLKHRCKLTNPPRTPAHEYHSCPGSKIRTTCWGSAPLKVTWYRSHFFQGSKHKQLNRWLRYMKRSKHKQLLHAMGMLHRPHKRPRWPSSLTRASQFRCSRWWSAQASSAMPATSGATCRIR